MDKKDEKRLIELLKEVKEIRKNSLSEGCYYCDMKDICKPLQNRKLPEHWSFPNNSARWRAEKWENYWYVDDCGVVVETTEGYFKSDDYRYNTHNYFRTKEEAEKYAKVLETEMLLRKFADENNPKIVDWNNMDEEKWYMSYKYGEHDIAIYVMYLVRDPRTIYFNSKEIAQEAIEKIGKDRLIEYLTYEW